MRAKYFTPLGCDRDPTRSRVVDFPILRIDNERCAINTYVVCRVHSDLLLR